MRITDCEWDDANIAHIARHSLSPMEVEEVFGHEFIVYKSRRDRYVAYGRTGEGRYLLVIFRYLGRGEARVITAREMTEQKLRYLKSVDEIPQFASEEEEAQFWDTHSPLEILDQLEEVEIEVAGNLKERIEERLRERLLSLFLKPEQIEEVKEIAKRKGIDYLALLQTWVGERIKSETGK